MELVWPHHLVLPVERTRERAELVERLSPQQQSCDIQITFTPIATGVVTDTTQLDYNDGVIATSATRDVQGEGVTPATLTISDGPTFDYGSHTVGATVTQLFTVTNTGGFPATAIVESALAAPFTFLGGASLGTGGTCTTTIASGANCTVIVEYAPVATGLQAGNIQLDYSDGATAQSVTRPIQGTGLSPATLSISDGPTYDFGTQPVGAAITHTFTITNGGGSTATTMAGAGLAAPYDFLGGAYPGTGGTCGATLAATLNCTIVVEYAPTGAATDTDTVDITYNDGAAAQTASRDLTAISQTPSVLTISDGPTFDYGNSSDRQHDNANIHGNELWWIYSNGSC